MAKCENKFVEITLNTIAHTEIKSQHIALLPNCTGTHSTNTNFAHKNAIILVLYKYNLVFVLQKISKQCAGKKRNSCGVQWKP